MREHESPSEIFPGAGEQQALIRGSTNGLRALAAQTRERRMATRRSGADGVESFDIHDLIDAVIDAAWSHDRDPDYLRLRRDLLAERLVIGMHAQKTWEALVRGVKNPSLPFAGWMEFPREAIPAFRHYTRTGIPEAVAILAKEATVQALLAASFAYDAEIDTRSVTLAELVAAGLPEVEPKYDWFDHF